MEGQRGQGYVTLCLTPEKTDTARLPPTTVMRGLGVFQLPTKTGPAIASLSFPDCFFFYLAADPLLRNSPRLTW